MRVRTCASVDEGGVNGIEFLQLASCAVTQSDGDAGVQRARANIKVREAQLLFKALARFGDSTWRP